MPPSGWWKPGVAYTTNAFMTTQDFHRFSCHIGENQSQHGKVWNFTIPDERRVTRTDVVSQGELSSAEQCNETDIIRTDRHSGLVCPAIVEADDTSPCKRCTIM